MYRVFLVDLRQHSFDKWISAAEFPDFISCLSLIQTGVNVFFFLQWIDFFLSDIQEFFSKLKNFQSQRLTKSEMAQIKTHQFEVMESNLTFESSNVRKNQ